VDQAQAAEGVADRAVVARLAEAVLRVAVVVHRARAGVLRAREVDQAARLAPAAVSPARVVADQVRIVEALAVRAADSLAVQLVRRAAAQMADQGLVRTVASEHQVQVRAGVLVAEVAVALAGVELAVPRALRVPATAARLWRAAQWRRLMRQRNLRRVTVL
jgi:hypothetical protein